MPGASCYCGVPKRSSQLFSALRWEAMSEDKKDPPTATPNPFRKSRRLIRRPIPSSLPRFPYFTISPERFHHRNSARSGFRFGCTENTPPSSIRPAPISRIRFASRARALRAPKIKNRATPGRPSSVQRGCCWGNSLLLPALEHPFRTRRGHRLPRHHFFTIRRQVHE